MVAIKDMAIPSCCGGCDFCTEYWECILLRKRVDNIVGTNAKHSDCPLVEIEERKVGKWVYKKLGDRTYGLVCSCCNYILCEGQNYDSLEEFKAWVNKRLIEPNIELDYFCHKCGADMRGSKNE